MVRLLVSVVDRRRLYETVVLALKAGDENGVLKRSLRVLAEALGERVVVDFQLSDLKFKNI
jgi:hypothetical protein